MRLNFKGTDIFYEDAGKGSAVVLLHGFLENVTIWNSLKEELLSRYRVITIDLLGHGKTGCLGYVHTMEMMAETVKAVLLLEKLCEDIKGKLSLSVCFWHNVKHMRPLPYLAIKLIDLEFTLDAGIIKSPSFSLCSSSTKINIFPRFASFNILLIFENFILLILKNYLYTCQ